MAPDIPSCSHEWEHCPRWSHEHRWSARAQAGTLKLRAREGPGSLEESVHPPVAQPFPSGLASGAVLEGPVGEDDLGDRRSAHRAG